MKILKKLSCLFVLGFMLLQNSAFATKNLNIAFVGLYASGKTALRAEATNTYFNYSKRNRTEAANVFCSNLRYFDKDINCHLYDTSGDDGVRNAIVVHRLKDADIAVLTIDASENATLGFNTVFKQNFVKWIGVINEVHPNLPVLLAITKIDDAIDVDKLCDKVKSFEKAYVDTCDFEGVATSAKKRINIGSTIDSNDLGENFWGRIRFIIKQRNLYDSLNEDKEIKVFDKDIDNPARNDSKCSIL